MAISSAQVTQQDGTDAQWQENLHPWYLLLYSEIASET